LEAYFAVAAFAAESSAEEMHRVAYFAEVEKDFDAKVQNLHWAFALGLAVAAYVKNGQSLDCCDVAVLACQNSRP